MRMRIALPLKVGLPFAVVLSLVFASTSLAYHPPALHYTGDAYNVYAKASVLGVINLGPVTINEVGPFSSSLAFNKSNTILAEDIPQLGLDGDQLTSSVVAGNNVSTARADTNALVLGLPAPGVPIIATGEVIANSKSKCNTSTGVVKSTGSSTIASLTIGTTTVVLPPPPIPANYPISLGPLGSITLNEQYAIPGGLAVNAIDIRLTPAPLATAQVIVSHAESDIESC